MVKPTLDKLAALKPLPREEPLVELRIGLTATEIAALREARDHVRLHMAHQHPWDVRDAAMDGIGKILAAADRAKS